MRCGEELGRHPGERPGRWLARRYCSRHCAGAGVTTEKFRKDWLQWDARDMVDDDLVNWFTESKRIL
jgi:hypothetical protein